MPPVQSGENITSAAWWHPAAQYTGKDIFGTTANYVKLFREKYKSEPDYAQASACGFAVRCSRWPSRRPGRWIATRCVTSLPRSTR